MIALATILGGLALVVTLTYWSLFPRTVTTITGVRLLTPVVKAGGTLEYDLDYCKSVNAPARVTRTLQNDVVILLASTSSNVRLGCGTLRNVVEIPPICHPARYTLDVLWQYDVNPLRTVTTQFTVGPFQVTAP